MCGALGRRRARCAGVAPAAARPAPARGRRLVPALLAYDGAGRELVARLKYRNARSSLPFLAGGLAALVADDAPFDVVTWAPTTAARRRSGASTRPSCWPGPSPAASTVPCRRLLLRPPGHAQTGQPLEVRRAGPAFRPARPPPRVLLVDDVVTSGATVAAAARTLRAAGALEVHAVAAARTAPGRRASPSGLHSERVAVCGSVVESRRQSQAKRPT